MIAKTHDKLGTRLILGFCLLLGLCLRLYHLGYQSLWNDEIFSAIESDPTLREHGLGYYLRHVDQQPPLFFLLERIAIFLFGNNEVSVRLIPALAGTACIAAIYWLGKEIHSKRLGLYAAGLMAINAYSIHYSNDARPYTLALFFSLLSWIFFLRQVRQPALRSALWYVIPTLLMLYSNYFGMLVAAGQAVVGVIIWIGAEERKKLTRYFLLAAAIIAVCFAPLLVFLSHVIQIKSFWAATPGEDVGINFFFEYFGNSDLLKPLLLLLLVCVVVRLVLEQANDPEVRYRLTPNRTAAFVFTVCAIWIFTCLFIPFLRSMLLVPMMVSRYSIMTLPAFILLIALGLDGVKAGIVRLVILVLFFLLSLTHIIVVKKYYTKITKTQFRELAQYLAKDKSLQFSVISIGDAWPQQYYLRKNNYAGRLLIGDAVHLTDSLAKAKVPIWLTSAHLNRAADGRVYEALGSGYMLVKEHYLHDAWAQLLVPRNFFGDSSKHFSAADFSAERVYREAGGDAYLPLWGSERLELPAVKLSAGAHRCLVVAKGTAVNAEYPHLRCYVNGMDVGGSFLTDGRDIAEYTFTLPRDTIATLSFAFDNDATDSVKKEDRNVFINAVIVTE